MNTSVSDQEEQRIAACTAAAATAAGHSLRVISMLICFHKIMMVHQLWWPNFSDILLGTDFTSTLLLLTVFSLSLIVNKTTMVIIICSLLSACA